MDTTEKRSRERDKSIGKVTGDIIFLIKAQENVLDYVTTIAQNLTKNIILK